MPTATARWLMRAALVVCATGCNTNESTPEPSKAVAAPASSANTESAKPTPSDERPKFPPEARRDSPPEAIADSALKVGSMAPALTNIASTAGEWSRGEKLAIVVFYRGHW